MCGKCGVHWTGVAGQLRSGRSKKGEDMNDNVNTTTNNWSSGLAEAWHNTLAFLPKALVFLAILAVGYFVATALGKVIDKVLEKVGFDRAVEKSGIKGALANSGYHPSDILGKVAFYTIFLFVLQLAFSVFGPNAISDLLTRVIAFLPNVFVAIVITVIAASIATAVKEIVRSTLGGLSYGNMLANVAAMSIVVIGVFAALNQLNIAPEIVNGLFYAILAIVVGVSIVAIGGAGIQPMRSRWENALNKLDEELPRAKQEVKMSAQMPQNGAAPAPRSDSGGYMG
jgi:MFS family permease